MASQRLNFLGALMAGDHDRVLQAWLDRLKAEGLLESGRLREDELRAQCASLLRLLRAATSGDADIDGPAFEPLRNELAELSRSRAMQGYSPRETASFVFALKRPLFDALGRATGDAKTDDQGWIITQLVDQLGLYTLEIYQRSREEVIARQNAEISELSTPVVKLWQGILALPVIGTLDSQRTQVVMENLLEAIVQQEAEIAIIDITGVATVDTLTAQHLLKTIAAARLMGADCIISGIRPQIAQTMVHLGVELSVVSKATLADAFALALARLGKAVTRQKPAAA